MRVLKYIFLSAILAGPFILIAQDSYNQEQGKRSTGTSGTSETTGNIVKSDTAPEEGEIQIFYEGNVKIIIKTINGVTTITYDSSANNSNKPDPDRYLEDAKDIYEQIKELEEKKKQQSYLNNPGGLDRDWKLVVEGPILGTTDRAQPDGKGQTPFAMSPSGRLIDVNHPDSDQQNEETESITTTSLSEQVTVYPNPAQAFVQVDLKGDLMAQVRVLDMQGKEVYTVPGMQQYYTRIDLTSLNEGIYLLEVSSQGERAIKQFMKY